MGKIETFEDIEAWRLAREITKLTYEVSSSAGFSKDFALTNQIVGRRYRSVEYAEGFERNGDKEFIQFFDDCERLVRRGKSSTLGRV